MNSAKTPRPEGALGVSREVKKGAGPGGGVTGVMSHKVLEVAVQMIFFLYFKWVGLSV